MSSLKAGSSAVVATAGLVVSGSTIVVSFMTYNERRESAGLTT